MTLANFSDSVVTNVSSFVEPSRAGRMRVAFPQDYIEPHSRVKGNVPTTVTRFDRNSLIFGFGDYRGDYWESKWGGPAKRVRKKDRINESPF